MAILADPPVERDPEDVRAAEDLVRQYCGWHIAPSEEHVVTLDGKGGTTLVLPTLHVTEIASIVEDGVTLPATAYEWSTSGLVDRVNGYWPRKYRSIVVTMTHGVEAYPWAVREFIKQLVESGAGQSPMTRAQVGQVVVTYAAPTPSWSVLDPYRRFGVA